MSNQPKVFVGRSGKVWTVTPSTFARADAKLYIERAEREQERAAYQAEVLAWGQGMERSIIDYYNIKDLREVYNNDLKKLRSLKLWLK